MLIEQMFDISEKALDQVSIKFLSEALNSQAGDKFDYIKFRKAILALQKMNMDKNTAIQSTLTTASTMGVNQSDIKASALKFMSLLDNEILKFDAALQKQAFMRIDEKKSDIQTSIKAIEDANKKIQELTELIKREELQQINLQEEIDKNQTLLDKKKQEFHQVTLEVKNLINEDINSLN